MFNNKETRLSFEKEKLEFSNLISWKVDKGQQSIV